MPKCLQLSKFYPPIHGGIETATRDIAEALYDLGWDVSVLCANQSWKTEIENSRIPVTRCGAIGVLASTSISPRYIFSLWKCRLKYDVIHLHHPNPLASLALFFCRPAGKLIVHWHSDVVKQRRLKYLFRPLQNWMLRRADCVIATSDYYANSSSDLQEFRSKVTVLPLASRDWAAEPQSKESSLLQLVLQKCRGRKVVLSVGRLVYYKGFDILLDTASKMKGSAIFIICGSGELKDELESKIRKLDLEEQVMLVGGVSREDLNALYRLADIFVLPSVERSEAFGVVLLEAMSFGIPMVATQIEGSGVSWVNSHNVTGLNVAPGDAYALRDALVQLICDEQLASEFSSRARQRYDEFFSLVALKQGLKKLYTKLE